MKSKSLIEELNETNLFIVRNDGVVIRNEFGFPELMSSSWGHQYIQSLINAKNMKFNRICKNSDYSFSAVIISDYLKENPDFVF